MPSFVEVFWVLAAVFRRGDPVGDVAGQSTKKSGSGGEQSAPKVNASERPQTELAIH